MLLSVAERVYRLFYDGFLSRLPEDRAVRLGQTLLRLLPVEPIKTFTLADPRLAVDLAGVRLPNPVILSSMYYDLAILRKAMALGFGAVTTKTITVTPRPGHPEPNLVRVVTPEGRGFVNCNGFRNPGLAAFRAALPRLPHRRPVIVSVAGDSPDEYRRLVQEIHGHGDLIELNISSPNTRLVYELSGSPERIRALFDEVRSVTAKPIIVKLSPDFAEENRRRIVPAVLDAGLDGVNFGNTRRVEHAGLSQRAGGLSGPALFANVVAAMRELRQALGPDRALIATGGIDAPAKALAAIEAGADAVSYFTAFITRGPTLARRIGEALLAALESRGARRVAELRGG
ncbi:MAG: dihydroorotate dehydrogenase [Candidatus Rokuibacteriota bacterium]